MMHQVVIEWEFYDYVRGLKRGLSSEYDVYVLFFDELIQFERQDKKMGNDHLMWVNLRPRTNIAYVGSVKKENSVYSRFINQGHSGIFDSIKFGTGNLYLAIGRLIDGLKNLGDNPTRAIEKTELFLIKLLRPAFGMKSKFGEYKPNSSEPYVSEIKFVTKQSLPRFASFLASGIYSIEDIPPLNREDFQDYPAFPAPTNW